MATFMEMINQGLGGLNTPLGQLGTQMMMNAGPQQGNPSAGVRLGQSFVGMQQQQYQQQQMEQAQQLRQIQQQEMALRARGLQRQEKQDQALQDLAQNPEAMANFTPLQRQALQLGTPMADVMKLNPPAKMPQAPGTVDIPQMDGTYIRRTWNPTSQSYEDSAPFTPPQAQTAAVAQDRWNTEKPFVSQEQARQERAVAATEKNAQTQAERVATQQAAEQRQQDANTMTSKFKRLEFKQAYRGAVSELDEVATLANEIANSPALPSLYGKNGYIPPIAGSDAASLQVKIDRLKAKGGLAELVKLKNNGVALTPVSNTDLAQAQTSFANFDKLQSDVAAKATFEGVAKAMQKAKDEAANRFNEYDSLYDVPGTSAPAARSAPAAPSVGTVMQGYRYNGGDPSSPQSWSKM